MPTYNLPNFTGGVDNALIGVATEVPSFLIMFLVFVWMFVFLGGVLRQNKRFGYADYPMWSVVASMSIFLISLILTLTTGLISLEVLGIVVGLTIVCGMWFFLTKGKTEI